MPHGIDPEITLFVDTPDGTWVRRVMPASVLPADRPPGYAAEDATRNAAAMWGLPDFVFKSVIVRTGSGQREIGDVIVAAGDLAACVQVKTREAATGNKERERQWLEKKVSHGIGQAAGSLRRLADADSIALVNERGTAVTVRPSDMRWVPVLLLDHPGLEGYVPRTRGAAVLLRRDWEFLFEQLKSTYAVLQYLEHVAPWEPIALGDEPSRYYQVALASLDKPPEAFDTRLSESGAVFSTPAFPLEPAPSGEIIRWILEDLAAVPLTDGLAPDQILSALAAVDSVPIGYRMELGGSLVSWFAAFASVPAGVTSWRTRRMASGTSDHLMFTVCNRGEPLMRDAYGCFFSYAIRSTLSARLNGQTSRPSACF